MTYIAITTGPIIETLNLTSKPAGLWAASYLFSEFSKQICKKLPKEDIVSPYFESDERCGAGLFPDRIILKANGTSLKEINGIIANAKKAVASSFGIDESYLRSYLQAHAIQFETDGNPIKDLSPFIAMMENERYFTPEEPENKLLAVIEKKQESDESASELVKSCTLVKDLGANWPLWADKPGGKIRNLAHISSNGILDPQDDEKITSPWKKHRYYAIIQADGDNIGSHITSLRPDEITEFSKKCWQYSKRADEIVRQYGGVTIYAGGDDLLTIVPMENKESKTVFDLMTDIRKAFKDVFGFVGSLSFGVAVRFYKYPLYESIKAAQWLLFEKAKTYAPEGTPVKNTIAFELQKHSGQAIGLLFPGGNENCCLTKLMKQIREISSDSASAENTGNLLHSIMSHIRIYEKVFATAIDEQKVAQAFKNIFNEEIHKDHMRITGAQELLAYCNDDSVSLIEGIADYDRRLMMLDEMLRLLKFFTEPGKEDDHA